MLPKRHTQTCQKVITYLFTTRGKKKQTEAKNCNIDSIDNYSNLYLDIKKNNYKILMNTRIIIEMQIEGNQGHRTYKKGLIRAYSKYGQDFGKGKDRGRQGYLNEDP
jgi:uncharacterized lipoprotein YajG